MLFHVCHNTLYSFHRFQWKFDPKMMRMWITGKPSSSTSETYSLLRYICGSAACQMPTNFCQQNFRCENWIRWIKRIAFSLESKWQTFHYSTCDACELDSLFLRWHNDIWQRRYLLVYLFDLIRNNICIAFDPTRAEIHVKMNENRYIRPDITLAFTNIPLTFYCRLKWAFDLQPKTNLCIFQSHAKKNGSFNVFCRLHWSW